MDLVLDPIKIDLKARTSTQLFYNIILLINGFEEYHSTKLDAYGRLPFTASFPNNHGILQENIVHRMIVQFLGKYNKTIVEKSSKIIISHDIDTLHSGFIYEFYRGMRTLDIPLIFRVLFAFATKKSLWWNLDEIIELLDKYDFKSIFYFIVENGRSADRIKNADYDISNPRIQEFIKSSINNGFEIGLHKSSLESTLDEEKSKMGNYCSSNRHHYLRYTIPDLYRVLDQSKFKTDCSLAFPYHMGFRNGYGLPFQPLDLNTGETMDILEIPFQIMDRMFDCQNTDDATRSSNEIIDFLDHNRYNAILGILWHNTDMNEVATKYSFEVFKRVLKYLHETDFETTTPSQVYKEYFNLT